MPKASSVRPDFSLLAPFWNERVERVELANGVTLLIKPDSSAPVASVQVWVKTGSLHEGTLLGSGVSHFVEHMLFKGTQKRDGRDISKTVQAHGGYINAYTTFDRTVYYIDLPSEHVGVAMDLLSDAVLESTFPEAEFKKERDVILREIDMGRDDPDQRMGETLFSTAFRAHPYRYPIIGHKEVFSALTREDLFGYYKARYIPNNLVVIVVGDVDVVQVRSLAEKTFGVAERKRLAPVLIEQEPAQLSPRENHKFEDVELTRAGMSWPIPGIGHADAPALDLLAAILGAGESSPLWHELRNRKRLVHSVDAHSWTPGTTGLFYISYTCAPEMRARAASEVKHLLATYAKRGFTRDGINKAIRQMIVAEINGRKTMSGQASRIGAAEVVVGDVGFAREYFEVLKRVTSGDLSRLIRTYLVQPHLTEVSLNPERKVEEGVEEGARAEATPKRIFKTLRNGAKLLLLPNNHLPNVHVRLLFGGGALAEETGKRGATSLLANLLTKDTKRRKASEVARHIEEVGGVFYPFSGNNSFGVAAEVLPGDLDRALTLIAAGVTQPAFAKNTFETERDAQLAELAQDRDDIVSVGRKKVREAFFGAYPLSIDSNGTTEDLEKLVPEDLRRLWSRCVVAKNAVLVVSGDIDIQKLAPRLEEWLGELPKGKVELSAVPFVPPAKARALVETMEREQVVVFSAFEGPGLKSADFHTGEVADELFSGMSSRLFERVREEKGLAYFVRSSRIQGIDTGMFFFYAGTAPSRYREVLEEIEGEIKRVAAGDIGADELLRCQVRLKAGRKMGLQTNSARAMHWGLNLLYGFPLEETEKYDERIDAVTVEMLAAFAKKYLNLEKRTQLVIGPVGKAAE